VGDVNDAPLKRGLIIHRLLQSLPALEEDKRLMAAQNYLGLPVHNLQPQQQADLIDEVMAILSDPDLQTLFGPDSKAEVPLAGWVQPSRDGVAPIAVSGQIDRLVVGHDDVLILDYKTDRSVPKNANDVVQSYIRQLAAYRAVLSGLYRGKPVRCNLLWTAKPSLMVIPEDLLDNAL
jgi:ATP-dependent helicase/nuclease subunit A